MQNQNNFITREVLIGNIAIGNNNPIRIQSMTTTKTEDIQATCDQILELFDSGCEIVRLTVQGQKQAYALEKIKSLLIQKNCLIPIVADIHFYPPAAMIASDFVQKIRINPGNFAEKRADFKQDILTQKEYEKQLILTEEKLFPLIEKLKKNKVALRIGVNHGSLSDRILNRYGNTIKAMVESAIEYALICRKLNFHDLVFSMKASSTFIMIEAYRALVHEMIKLKWDYPLHVGVTEAGDVEDGVIKSAIGIGSLLLDGIGDTIRVSLTGDPVNEIKPAKNLIELCKDRVFEKRASFVFSDKTIDVKSNEKLEKNIKTLLVAKVQDENSLDKKLDLIDIVYLEKEQNSAFIDKLKKMNKKVISKEKIERVTQIFNLKNLSKNEKDFALEISSNDNLSDLKILKKLKPTLIIFKPEDFYVDNIRKFSKLLKELNSSIPVIAHLNYQHEKDDLKIIASAEIGLILYEKLVDGIFLDTFDSDLELSLNILQGCNLKKYKTEFISCPGCGRTLFDIQKATKEIKAKTSHLPDIKIAIMGCIVNGPGEMQDADFGYVGSLPKKIDLYVNRVCVEKNIDESLALEKLIALIKQNNKWRDL